MIIPTESIGSNPGPLGLIDLNNLALASYSPEEPQRIGIHTCPGSDRDSTLSGDAYHPKLFPSIFCMRGGNVYIAITGEKIPVRVLKVVHEQMRPGQRIIVGVTSPTYPRVETPMEVCDRIFQVAEFIPPHQLGSTDDGRFSPFCDDTFITRERAFGTILGPVLGAALASTAVGGV